MHTLCAGLQGYLSEAGASLVDEKLQLNIVPKTRVCAHGGLGQGLSRLPPGTVWCMCGYSL